MFEKTEQLICELLENKIVPGFDYTLIHHGEIVRDVTKGYQMLKPQKLDLKSGMYFDIASLTKVIGMVPLILILEQRGQLNLDDLVQQYLSQIKTKHVTIRHLITHTSGAEAWIDHRDELNASQLRTAIYQAISFGKDFNQRVVYNDYNYLLLGFIAEKILHVPVQTAIKKYVLELLGMYQSTFIPNPLLTVPTEIRNDLLTCGKVHDPKANSLGLHAGSAGLFATKHDVVLFTLKMLAKENEVFDNFTLNRFLENQTANPELSRSLGWAFVRRNQQQVLLRHSGFTGTFILFDRITQNGLVFLSNRVHPTPNLQFLDYRQKIYQIFAEEDL